MIERYRIFTPNSEELLVINRTSLGKQHVIKIVDESTSFKAICVVTLAQSIEMHGALCSSGDASNVKPVIRSI